jgi:hypothetical protein
VNTPVFVHLDFWRHDPINPPSPGTEDEVFRLRWPMYLFGVISGHWDLKRQDSAQDSFVNATEDEEIDKLNTGIAIVTPIQEVLNLINSEEVMAVRRKAERQHTLRNQPTYDPIVPPRRKKQTRKKRPKK